MLDIKEINPTTDNIDVSFSGKGIIHILDDEGNLILKATNMIVKTGRQLIYKACKGERFDLTNANVVIGYDDTKNAVTEAVEYDDVSSSIHNSNSTVLTVKNVINETNPEIAIVADDAGICFKSSLLINNTCTDTLDINSDNSFKINWIGIVVNNNVLFSKSLFNTIIVPPNRSIIINYNVYF